MRHSALLTRAGGPNSNDSNSNKLLHHTIGLLDREQEMRCFQQVTCAQVPKAAPVYACAAQASINLLYVVLAPAAS